MNRTLSKRGWLVHALAVFTIVGFGLGLAPAQAANLPGPLVDASWLKQHKGEVVLLDVRKKAKNFEAHGHIPGAVLVPWKQVRGKKKIDGVEYIKMLPSATSFTRLMKVSGVNKDSAVVITTNGLSSKDVFFGTRLYWQMKYYGHKNVAMLDGGNAAWAQAKLPMSKDKPGKVKGGNWSAGAENKDLLASTMDVAGLIKSGASTLVDARTLDYHLGLEQKKKYVYQAGHLPGSKLVPHDILVTHGKAAKFRDAGQLKSTLAAMGVDLSAANVAYCNSGHLGSGLWFVLHELAGNDSATLYDGSMHAWTEDKSRPVTAMKLN